MKSRLLLVLLSVLPMLSSCSDDDSAKLISQDSLRSALESQTWYVHHSELNGEALPIDGNFTLDFENDQTVSITHQTTGNVSVIFATWHFVSVVGTSDKRNAAILIDIPDSSPEDFLFLEQGWESTSVNSQRLNFKTETVLASASLTLGKFPL